MDRWTDGQMDRESLREREIDRNRDRDRAGAAAAGRARVRRGAERDGWTDGQRQSKI